MNFYKNIFKTYPKYCYSSNRPVFSRKLHNVVLQKSVASTNHANYIKFTKRKNYTKTKLYCSTYNPLGVEEIEEEVTDLYPYLQNQPLTYSNLARGVLFKDTKDPKVIELEKCASIEGVFAFVRQNAANLNYEYLTQIVLVLSDLQNIFIYHLNEDSDNKPDFFKKLLEHPEFFTVLKNIENKLDSYDALHLSFAILYLNKLGLPEDSKLIQDMAMKIRDHLLNEEFTLDISARFLKVICRENSVRPYYTAIDVIPKVFEKIDSIQTIKEFEDITTCLNSLCNILTNDIVNSYVQKVEQFIQDNKLASANYQIILKIVNLLNNSKIRNKHSELISRLILLMQDSIELMNFKELELLYLIFFKCQEPGEALNTIQRASAKIFHELEDNQLLRESQLKLFSCLIYFSSPIHKMHFRQNIKKYINEKETLNSLLVLSKIFFYLKVSDTKMCDLLWTRACQALNDEHEFNKISKLFESYFVLSSDNSNYRNFIFENHILRIIQRYFEAGDLTLVPSNFFSAFSFVLLYCRDVKLVDSLMNIFEENKSQIGPNDLLRLSQVTNIMKQQKQKSFIVSKQQLYMIHKILNETTERISNYTDDIAMNTLLIKSAILRNNIENDITNEIILKCKNINYMSSKVMENLWHSLIATKSLVPEIMNRCIEYVVKNKSNILGFNAEKILYMCYSLNYFPVYAEEFFQTTTDVIIRDQERLSGLAFLQSALSLCYFNRLPKSFIKQIFNVEFLDKLDVELANCYYREKYPQRVRKVMMQLNRAVCLEYPEFNVPWFHQKYIDEFQKINALDDIAPTFQLRVKDYLFGIVDKSSILENVLSPYGYHINFVIHLDKENKPTTNFENSYSKLAVLLKNDNAFTRFFIRLKGKHEMKNRHLEILGYKVKIIKFNEWINLLYANERIEFMKAVVFS